MKFFNLKFLIILLISIFSFCLLTARQVESADGDKKLDLVKFHNVGNIWLRVSNYGFFGSGDDIVPQYPSLEYPGGSGIDYLYQGALWFGAKKVRRNTEGTRLFWRPEPDDEFDVIAEFSTEYDSLLALFGELTLVVDTLTTVGFDGDADLYEFLPAYNPLETSPLGQQFQQYNPADQIMTASIRNQRTAKDDDNDGLIDEDPVGYSFPFRASDELPEVFSEFGGKKLHELDPDEMVYILENEDIWFPLGFVDLSVSDEDEFFNFAEANDDDNDGLDDEDGYPVSEQDFISYYYDYSPFGTSGERDWGSSNSRNDHYPLNVRIRQMSYQWSYEHIKNLVYVEFDITNMNPVDILYDCAMGIYMDSDVGPQSWGSEKASDDISSYVRGEGYEFAFTYDWDGDGGLSNGMVGSRVCTPDPDILEFACWTWKVGDGPDDEEPLDLNPSGSPTANQKYWLLTDRNPDDTKYTSLKDFPDTQYGDPVDTRYLFAFYGDMLGLDDPTESSWNLPPGMTMKIVIAVFPGDDLLDLKQTSIHAKDTYGEAQTLTTVVLPDTFKHYTPPNPPEIPMLFAELVHDGNRIDVYWDNRSQIDNVDVNTVKKQYIGWQNEDTDLDSYVDNYDADFPTDIPDIYPPNPDSYNDNAMINPWTGYRLRHDFQGYTLWGRSGSGSHEFWVQKERWDKHETTKDEEDYLVNYDHPTDFLDFGGVEGGLGINKGLPNGHTVTEADTNYYHFDPDYNLEKYTINDPVNSDGYNIYGYPIYNHEVIYSADLQTQADGLSFDDQSLLFKHPDMRDDIYLSIYDDRLIPLNDHGGQAFGHDNGGVEDPEFTKRRLARRYYTSSILYPPKGIEYYVAVTAWDRGIPELSIPVLESARDADANMKVFFPGPTASSSMDNIHVVPNPYVGQSKFDGRRENDDKGDKSRRLWFVDIPERCKIKIFTLAGDLVDEIDHEGNELEDIISTSKAASVDGYAGVAASGIASWDLLSRNNQIIAPGIYLFSVKDLDSGDIKVGKFVIIK